MFLWDLWWFYVILMWRSWILQNVHGIFIGFYQQKWWVSSIVAEEWVWKSERSSSQFELGTWTNRLSRNGNNYQYLGIPYLDQKNIQGMIVIFHKLMAEPLQQKYGWDWCVRPSQGPLQWMRPVVLRSEVPVEKAWPCGLMVIHFHREFYTYWWIDWWIHTMGWMTIPHSYTFIPSDHGTCGWRSWVMRLASCWSHFSQFCVSSRSHVLRGESRSLAAVQVAHEVHRFTENWLWNVLDTSSNSWQNCAIGGVLPSNVLPEPVVQLEARGSCSLWSFMRRFHPLAPGNTWQS